MDQQFAPLYYLEAKNPMEIVDFCDQKLDDWPLRSLDHKLSRAMERYKKQRAMNMVWQTNKLEGTLPDGHSQRATFKILEEIYDSDCHKSVPNVSAENEQADSNAEKHRKTVRQLSQHMKAYKFLCNEGTLHTPLTEESIKTAHKELMGGLSTDDGEVIHAGEYRLNPVHAGSHAFPDFNCIPREMKRLIEDYNQKVADREHNKYVLASWLLFRFVSLHPFEEGNGRMCRLLWCYSLMKDGLPFPLTISSGYSSAHHHYVKEIEADRRSMRGQPHLSTLTVISIRNAWSNFELNLQFELNED